jgi:Holliday junction resolvase RusA-like endonuclease
MIRFWLPEPPSANALHLARRSKKTGKFFLNPRYAQWRAMANACGLQQAVGKMGRISGKYSLELTLPATRKDCDNCIKSVSDICVRWALVDDDRCMKSVSATIDPSSPPGICWVVLKPMPEEALK